MTETRKPRSVGRAPLRRSLRILHLGKYYPPARGGIETVTRVLARGQAARGHDVAVLCIEHRNPPGEPEHETDGPVRVHRIRRRATLARCDWCPGLRRRLRGLLQEADIVHLHVPNPTMMLGLVGLDLPGRLVVGYHSDIVKQRLLARLLSPFEWNTFRRTAAFLVSSQAYRDASGTLQRHEDRVHVVPLGLNLEPFRKPSARALAIRDRLRDSAEGPLWLCVGRLVYYKGFEVAIRALRSVPGRLCIVGGGPLRMPLEATARREGVAERVHWMEQADADELVGCYHAATALWMTSIARSESFGLVQVEALASGCPVINTAIPGSGVTSVGGHGRTGETVPPGDPGAPAAAAGRLLDDPERRRRFAIEGRRAAFDFDEAAMTNRVLAIYDHVLGRSMLLPTPGNRGKDPRVNVLHVTAGRVLGGVERFLETVVCYRAADPRTQHRFAVCGEGAVSMGLRGRGAEVYDLGRVRRRYPWTVFVGRRRLGRVIDEHGIDAVVLHSAWPFALFGIHAVTHGRPLVVWQHGGANPEHWVDKSAAQRPVDLVIGNSAWTLGTVTAFWGGAPRRIVRYPVAPNTHRFDRASRERLRREFHTSDDDVVVVTASRMESWKGHDLLLRALAGLPRAGKWTCWIVGGPQQPEEHEYLAALARTATQLGLADRVRFLGQRNDVPAILSAADVHCQPNTDCEPFGIAFVEALAAGLPVITTDLGGVGDLVDESTGELVPPEDESALTAALNRAIADRDWREVRAANGPRRARTLCDPQARVREIGDVLHELVETPV